jgi:TPR repeat protein
MMRGLTLRHRRRAVAERTALFMVAMSILLASGIAFSAKDEQDEKLQEMYKVGLRLADSASADHNALMAAYFFFRAAAAGHGGALAELRRMAQAGEPEARFRLGVLHAAGRGVPRDFHAASSWWRMAAEQGMPDAQRALAELYRDGQGVPADPVQAYFWLSLAAAQGDSDAAGERERLAQHMNQGKITEAERLAREWRETRQDR